MSEIYCPICEKWISAHNKEAVENGDDKCWIYVHENKPHNKVITYNQWQAGIPPHNKIVIVELDGQEIEAIAVHGGEGNLPHWKNPDDSKAWPKEKFKRWRNT